MCKKNGRNGRDKANSDGLSAFHKDYWKLKSGYPDAILFISVGDFYEMYFEDAEVASRVLDIPMSTRGLHKGATLFYCAVPFHRAKGCIQKLLNHDWNVVICEDKPEGHDETQKVRTAFRIRSTRREVNHAG
jgi:DNA mismatch repair ATPase MutS